MATYAKLIKGLSDLGMHKMQEYLDGFDFTFQPSINKKQLFELNNLGFVDKKENILFVGSSGVGKTHLATFIGITCARSRISTYFIPFESLST